MTLPTFIGIGAPRAGTTWLNNLLSSHRSVYTPARRDEINFYDHYYVRGLDWYQTLFPTSEEAQKYKAIGEITPQYLECAACPQRIAATLPEAQLIVMLRHPVDRAYSQYGFFVQRRNFRGTFEEFLLRWPRSLERGYYSRLLKRYLACFERSQILVLLFEKAVSDVTTTKSTLASFLDIAVDGFPGAVGGKKVNPSSVPRFQFAYGMVAKMGRQFRRWHLEPVVDFVMRTRIPRVLAKGRPLPALDEALRKQLSQAYQDEFDELERCMGIDLGCWRR